MSADDPTLQRLQREITGLNAKVSALEAEAQRFKTTLQSIGDAVIATDTAGRVTQVNPVAETLTGWTEAEALGKPLDEVFRIVNEETRAEVDNPVERVLREGAVVGLANHTVLIARDGTRTPVADSGAPIRDAAGSVAGVVLVFRDQSDERRAAEEVKAAEERFRTFFDNAPIGKSMTAPDGKLLRVNPAFGAMLGYSVEELQSISFSSITHPDDLAESRECVRALLAGEQDTWAMDKRYLSKDGRHIWMRVTTRLQRDHSGKPLHFLTHMQDITERKNTEEALRLSEEKYRGLFDNAAVGVYRSRLDGSGIVALNQCLADIFGYPKEEMLSSPAALRWADPMAREAMVRVLRERGVLRDHELDIVTKGGKIRTVLASIKLYPREGYLEGTAIDITERRRAEQSLQETQYRLEEAQRVARVGSWELDVVRDVITGSPEFYRLFDVAPEQIIHYASFVERLHPDDRERVQRDVADALQQARLYDTDYRVNLGDGRWRDINARGKVIVDEQGRPTRFVGSCMDITERKRTEAGLRRAKESLQASEDGHRTLIESLPQLIWTCRGDGPCDFLSKQWVEYTGIPEAEQFGYGWLEQIHPDDRQRVIAEWSQVAPLGNPFDIEFRIRRNDGVYRWFKTRALPLRDATGQLVKWFGSNTDIEDAKALEAALQQANANLGRSNQELEQFAYVASHDLQEPLRMVSSFTQLLAQRYQDKLDQDAKDFIGYAVDGANRMQRLIQDLLEYSRVTTRGQAPAPLDAHDALGEAVRNLQAAIQETGALVTNDELPRVCGDYTQIVQVFQNLIGNGLKFRKPGEPPRVHLSAERNAKQPDFWTFKIADNGIGIEPRHFDRLFVIFQRLHGKQEYPGTGIGLALCKRIVERHGGKIWLESEAGQGTTFFFTLPSAQRGEGAQR